MITKFKKFALVACYFAFAGGAASAATVTYNTTNSNNSFPFASGPMDYQQLYVGSRFATGPVQITGISFKAAQDNSGHSFGPTPVTLDIDLSTTTAPPASLSPNFAANKGADDLQVFSGTAFISSSGADVFDIMFPFTTNFMYDPSLGNLLARINVHSSQGEVGQFAFGESSDLARVYYGYAQSNAGLATQFETASEVSTSVPEPTSVMLIGLGLFGLVATRLKTKKQ